MNAKRIFFFLCFLVTSSVFTTANTQSVDTQNIVLTTDHSSYLATDIDGTGPIEGSYRFTLTARVTTNVVHYPYDSPARIHGKRF